jgi:hypothetical protein
MKVAGLRRKAYRPKLTRIQRRQTKASCGKTDISLSQAQSKPVKARVTALQADRN